MIRNPINVYPYNNPIDATQNNIFKFTFSGDMLIKYKITINNLDTGTTSYSSDEVELVSTKYNGEIIEFELPDDSLLNGKEYVWYLTLWESEDSPSFATISYYFKTLTTPSVVLKMNEVTITTSTSSTLDKRSANFKGTYSQLQSVPIKHYSFYLKDAEGNALDSKEKQVSANIVYTYDSFISNNEYALELVVENQENQVIDLVYPIQVEYNNNINFTYPPIFESIEDKGAIRVKWIKDKIANAESSGEYTIDEGTSKVQIDSGTIEYNNLTQNPLVIDENNFGFAIKTTINEKTKEIFDFCVNGHTYSFFIENYNICCKEDNGATEIIDSLFSSSSFLLSFSIEDDTGYYWYSNEEDMWVEDDATYWQNPSFEKTYVIVFGKTDGEKNISIEPIE